MSTHSLPGNIENVPPPAIPPDAPVGGCWNRVETAAARVLQAIGHCFVEMGSRFRDLVTVIRNITKIIPSNMVGTSIIKTMRATAKILHNVPGNNQWHERDELVDCIFKNYKYLEGHERARVMQVVEEIPASERFSVVFHTQKVIDPKGRYNVDETLQVLQGVRAIPTDKRSSVVIDAQEVIALKWCSIEDRLTVLKAVCDMPAENRRMIIKNASKLFLINMDVRGRISMIQAMRNIPINEITDATDQALQIIPPGATPEEKISIVRGMANIAAPQRAAVLEDLEGMVFVNRNPATIIAFLETVRDILADERTQVDRLVNNVMPLEANAGERPALLQAVRAIPAWKREQIIINTCKLITPNMNVGVRIFMMRSMTEISIDEITDATDQALRIIPPRANAPERMCIVQSMAKIPAPQRAVIREELEGMIAVNWWEPADISVFLEAMHEISADERTQVVRLVANVMPLRASARERLDLLQAVRAIPGANGERETIITNTRKLITHGMNVAARVDMIRFMKGVPTNINEITQATDQALRIIPLHATPIQKISIVDGVARFPAQLRVVVCDVVAQMGAGLNPLQIIAFLGTAGRVLRMDLDARDRFLQGMRDELGLPNAAAGPAARPGMDVHANDRDQRTRDALVLLRQHQERISEGDINNATTDFTTYLDQRPNSEDRQIG